MRDANILAALRNAGDYFKNKAQPRNTTAVLQKPVAAIASALHIKPASARRDG